MNISDTLERGILFLSYCYSERISYDDACHLKKCCVNPVQKKVTALSKRQGKMDMVVDKFQFILWIYGSNPIATPTIKMNSMK